MGIKIKLDTRFGEIVEDAYVKIDNIKWESQENEWSVKLSVWLSKEARDIDIIAEFIICRMAQQKETPIDFDPEYASEIGVSEEEWNVVTKKGPWKNIEDILYINKTFLSMITQPIDETEYTTKDIAGFPENISDVSAVKTWFYNHLANGELTKLLSMGSPRVSAKEISASAINDDDSFGDVVKKYIQKYPVLGEKFDKETKIEIRRSNGQTIRL